MRKLFVLFSLLALPLHAQTDRSASIGVSAQVMDAFNLSPSALTLAANAPPDIRTAVTMNVESVINTCQQLFVESMDQTNVVTAHRFAENMTTWYFAKPDGTTVTKSFAILSLSGERMNSGDKNPEYWVKRMVNPCVIESSSSQVTQFSVNALKNWKGVRDSSQWVFSNHNLVHVLVTGARAQVAIVDF